MKLVLQLIKRKLNSILNKTKNLNEDYSSCQKLIVNYQNIRIVL